MSRGSKVNIEEYMEKISPYLEAGCSLHEACLHGVIPYTTMKDYQDNNDEVRKNIERLQNIPILIARRSVNNSMKENGELALKYLERKRKDEFGTKQEINLGGQAENPVLIEEVSSSEDRLLMLLQKARDRAKKKESE